MHDTVLCYKLCSISIAPEDDDNPLSIGGIVAIVVVAIVAIVAIIIAFVVFVACMKRGPLSTTVTDFHRSEKGEDNAYDQFPGSKRQAKGEVFIDIYNSHFYLPCSPCSNVIPVS